MGVLLHTNIVGRRLDLTLPFTITPTNYRSMGPVRPLPNVEVMKDATNEEVTITIMHQGPPVSAAGIQSERSQAVCERWVVIGNFIVTRTEHKQRYEPIDLRKVHPHIN